MKNEAYVVVDRIQKCYLNMNIKAEHKNEVIVKVLWIVRTVNETIDQISDKC